MTTPVKLGSEAAPTKNTNNSAPKLNDFLDSLGDEAPEEGVEDTKVEDTKVEDTKVEDTKVEDTKVEEQVIPFDILAEDTKVEDTKVEDEYAPPEAKDDPKAAHAWAELKRQNKELKAEAARLKDERGTGSAEREVELRKQIEQYEEKLGQYDLSSTRTFQETYSAPMQRLASRAATTLVNSGVEPAEAASIVQKVFTAKTQAEIDDQVADQPLSVQAAMVTLSSEYRELDAARVGALKSWRDTRAALAEKAARDEEIALAEMAHRDTGEALAQVLAEGNWMFRRTDGKNPEWDANVDTLEATVRGIVKNAKPSEIIKWTAEGVTAKPLRELFAKEHQRAERLQAELKAALGAAPKLGADGKPAAADDGKGILGARGPKKPGDVINALFPKGM